jgi:hypothetical protein
LARRAGILAPAVIAVILLILAGGGSAHAAPTIQAAPAVTDGGVVNNFPDGMVFSVHAESVSNITDIRLRYEVLPDGTAATARPQFAQAKSVDAQVTLDTYLAPGTVIKYHWEALAGSSASATDEATFVYDDTRFQWQVLDTDNLAIHHYSGSDEDAQKLHGVGVQALADAEALLNTQVPFGVNVWIYDSTDDMRPALPRTSPAFESQIITEGIKIASNTVLVLGGVSYDTLRHELTHVVTALAGDSPFGTLPNWLDEGTAVHAQQDPGGFGDAIEQAISRGNVLSVREIGSYPGDPQKVELFYGEAWSLVSFLVDTYGQEKFAQLFASVKSGKTFDEALQVSYGFDQDGLENAWRAAKGLPPAATQAPTGPAQQGSPTVTPRPSGDGGGTSTGTLIAIAAGVLVLAGLVGFGGITLARRLG